MQDEAEQRVRASFARQQAMATIGAEIARVAPGEVDIVLPFAENITRQHGFIHAGMIALITATMAVVQNTTGLAD